MNLADLLSSQTWWALGSAVVQFVWQGALIGCVTLVLLRSLQRRSAEERYAVSMTAMLLCLVTFAASFVSALGSYVAPPQVEVTGESLAGLAFGDSEEAWWSALGMTGFAAWVWALGVCLSSLRFAYQCFGAHRLRTRSLAKVDDSLQRIFDSLKNELGVDRKIRLLKSGLAEVPMVVGWLSPIVLLPSAALLSLDPEQLRALLAHELAHIRRNDHWLNAAQAVVEILLFFHPAVWWISRQVRIEREFCCDDSSLRLTGNPRLLAEALASMEALRLARPSTHTILAANGGPLMQRITRILEVGQQNRSPLTSWLLPAGILVFGSLAAVASASTKSTSSAEPTPTVRIDDKSDYHAMEARIKAAVVAGRLTEAEAKATISGIRKSMGWDVNAVKRRAQADLKLEEIDVLKTRLETMMRERELLNAEATSPNNRLRVQRMAEDQKRARDLEVDQERYRLETMKLRQVLLNDMTAELHDKREAMLRDLREIEKQLAERSIEDSRAQRAEIQAKLEGLRPAHPQYKILQQEHELLRTRLERQAVDNFLQRSRETQLRPDDALEGRRQLELALKAAQDREAQLVDMLKAKEQELRRREELDRLETEKTEARDRLEAELRAKDRKREFEGVK